MAEEKNQEMEHEVKPAPNAERALNPLQVNQLAQGRLPFKPSQNQICQALGKANGPSVQNALIGQMLLGIHEQLVILNQQMLSLQQKETAPRAPARNTR